jgi:hypothetical protein
MSEEFIRAADLSVRFPVLGRTTWNNYVTRGALKSHKIGRARIVRIADVVAFLEVAHDRALIKVEPQ